MPKLNKISGDSNLPIGVMEKLEQKIVYWKEKLLDLSRRNKLIAFRDFKTSTLLIQPHDPLKKFEAFIDGEKIHIYKFREEIENDDDQNKQKKIIASKRKKKKEKEDLPIKINNIWIPDYSNKETQSRLYNLYLKSKESLREQGINTFFVTFGLLHYYDVDHSDQKISAPLLMVQASIKRVETSSKNKHRYEIIADEEDVQFNPSLEQKLKIHFNLKVPEIKEGVPLKDWLKEFGDSLSGKEKWKVEKNLCVGIFSFRKLLLYLDLERFKEKILKNPILQVLCGAPQNILGDFDDIPEEKELDNKIKPSNIHQVLDADSSQQVVIEAAKKGLSFVVQGPPGTGKSQTIVNIIAEFLSLGKKVLFVSQKAAALEVVKKRLDSVGLGEYCLELHSYKANKKTVLKQLEKQLMNRRKIESSFDDDDEEFFSQLSGSKKELNILGEQLLKERGEIKKSLYEIIGDISVLENVPQIECGIKNPLNVSRQELNIRITQLSNIESYHKEISNYEDHLWKGTIIERLSLSLNKKINERLDSLVSFTEQIKTLIKETGEKIEIDVNNLDSLNRVYLVLQKIQEKPKGKNLQINLFSKNLDVEKGQTRRIIENLEESKKISQCLADIYEVKYFNLPVEKILVRFQKIRGFSRLLESNCRSDIYSVLKLFKKKTKIFSIEIEEDLKKLLRLKNLKKEHKLLGINLSKFYEEKIDENEKYEKWQSREKQLIWLKEIKKLFPILSKKLIEKILNDENALLKLLKKYEKTYEKEFKPCFETFLSDYFSESFSRWDKSVFNIEIKTLFDWLLSLKNNVSSLRGWLEFNNHIHTLDEELKEYVEKFLRGHYPAKHLAEAYRKKFLLCLLEKIDENLDVKEGEHYDFLIKKFKKLDRKHQVIALKNIIYNLEKNKPHLGGFKSANTSEIGILRREIHKKKRHKPLRELFVKTSNLTLILKPCFMMSPLSVAQYINFNEFDVFDVVIFDEASQIMTEDAVGSIVRAKQSIIVGDSQQLPPTSFFSSLDDGLDEREDEIEDLASILEDATTLMKQKYLCWHYRSKDESLIAFSNRKFYDSRLVTFPNNELLPKNKGIEYVFVKDGVYDRGGSRQNVEEAKQVIKLIEKHIKKSPDKSLGVVAFSMQQQRAIQDQVEIFRRKNPKYSSFFEEQDVLNEFFVKNLERIQGDERDVMIFSVGYGPDANKKMTLNFGPINKTGGYKRLNVAITRAREKIYLVSSFHPESIDLQKVSNEGLKSLLLYMKYAKNPESLMIDISVSDTLAFESDFEEAVYNKLTERGWDLAAQVGTSGYRIDLAIKHPNKKGEFILGIECDGAAYHSSATARDRDRLRQLVLEGLGWKIHRIWSTDWIIDSNIAIKKIEKKIKSILNENQSSSKNVKRNKRQEKENSLIVNSNQNSDIDDFIFPEYEAVALRKKNRGIRGFNSARSWQIKEDIADIIKKETPIYTELLLKRIAEGWGIAKIGANVRRTILEILDSFDDSEIKQDKIDKGILWHEKKEKVVPFRKSTENNRPTELIPLGELGGLIVKILTTAFSIEKDDLMLEMSKQLGHSKRGNKIASRLEKTINYLKEIDIIVENDDRIELKNKKIF